MDITCVEYMRLILTDLFTLGWLNGTLIAEQQVNENPNRDDSII
jgi:hypothetical protein